MKIIIEPNRSIIPELYHTTTEYEFEIGMVTKESIEDCIAQINPMPTGMVGISTEDSVTKHFFVTVDENGKLQEW